MTRRLAASASIRAFRGSVFEARLRGESIPILISRVAGRRIRLWVSFPLTRDPIFLNGCSSDFQGVLAYAASCFWR